MSAAAFHGFTLLCREAQTVSRSTPETPFVLYYSQTRNTSFKPFLQENTFKYFESFQNTFMNTSLKSKHAKF